MGWKWRTSQGSLTAAVDFHGVEVIIFHSWKDFSFPILCWSSFPFPSSLPSIRLSAVCAGGIFGGKRGIKVALLSSKLQISFASVHLTRCFITVARGATRLGSPPCKVITSSGYYSILPPLSATLLLLPPPHSGVAGYI